MATGSVSASGALSLSLTNAAASRALMGSSSFRGSGGDGRGLTPLPRAAGGASLAAVSLLLLRSSRSARCFTVGAALLALRSAAPLACLVVARNALALLRRSGRLTLRRVLWQAVSVWSVAEVAFLVYFFQCRHRCNSQTTKRWQAVTTHSTEEKRKLSLERYLTALMQVCKVEAGDNDQPPTSAKDAKAAPAPGSPGLLRSARRKPGCAPGLLSARVNRSSESLTRQRSWSRPQDASVDDMLQLWDEGGKSSVGDEELFRLKRVELSSWFTGSGRGDPEDPESWLRRGNVEEWISHYWFRGATPQELGKQEYQELRRLVTTALESAGLGHLAEGRNPRITAFRLASDPLPVLHRPLFMYVASSVLCPLLSSRVMTSLGFTRERVGGLLYWMRPRRADVPASVDVAAPRQTPLVFVHGLGAGLVPYFLFISRLSRSHSGVLLVPEFPFLAMAPWESVPSAREIVAQLQDMLTSNRCTGAHFMGHSFGAVVIGWMLKMSPSSVVYTTLMEPALFLMLKSDILTKVLFAPPRTGYEMLIRYFAFRELFTVNLICRNFFWEQSQMWPEDLRVPTVVQLASDDHIVHSFFVRRLLEHERAGRKKKRRQKKPAMAVSGSSMDVRSCVLQSRLTDCDAEPLEIQWCPGFFHGEILFRREATEKLFALIRKSVQGEGGV